MATQFKRYGRGGRFKKPVIGDAGISALRQRDQTIIDSLKLSRSQQVEIDRDQKSAIERAFLKEEQNIEDLQALEDKIYANKRDNIKLRAQRVVEALQGQADEYGRAAEHWKELTPKLSKALTGLAEGYHAVATRMGYEQALKNQGDHDTLSIWEKNFEDGIQIAHETLQSDENELLSAGATPTQLASLETTSAFYKNGTVWFLTKDLEANMDAHIRSGMAAYTKQFGPPTTQAQYNKAMEWIKNTIEKSVGISTYKYHGGVRKWREAFNEAVGIKSKDWTNDRLFKINTEQLKRQEQIFESKPGYQQQNLDNMIRFVKFHYRDKDGKAVATNDSEAIRFIFSRWAGDLKIKEEEVIARLKLLTPEKGRQPGDKATVGGRFPGLLADLKQIRLDAIKKQNDNHNISKKAQEIEAFEKMYKILDDPTIVNNPAAFDKAIMELDNSGPSAKGAVAHLRKVQRNNFIESTGIRQNALELISEGKYRLAQRLILDNVVLKDNEKKELLGLIQHVPEWASLDLNPTDVKKDIEPLIRKIMGYNADDDTTNDSAKRKTTYALGDLTTYYYAEKIKLDSNKTLTESQKIRKAYNDAFKQLRKDINSKQGEYEVILAGDRSDLNAPIFADHYNSQISVNDKADYTTRELLINLSTNDGALKVFNDNTKSILTRNQEKDYIQSLQNGDPINNIDVDQIAKKLPKDHVCHGSFNCVLKSTMQRSKNKDTQEAAELILPDWTDQVGGIDKENQAELTKALNRQDLINRIAWIEFLKENGTPPIRPEVLTPITEALTPLSKQELEQQLDGYRKQGWIWDPFSQGYYKREVSY